MLVQTGFNGADWAIVVVVGLSILISLSRGFVREALSLLVWVAAFVVAFLFSAKLSPLLANAIDVPSLRYAAAFALLFVVTLIVGSLISYIVAQLVKMTGLSAV
ncbi:MAG TPA: CvpA family protein, partial [Pseudomonadales bacterium]|nr:CvpA family protein [Pseudomonadales bacterium]